MDLLSLGIGFAAGFLVGGLGIVLYMRWKMMSQLSTMQSEMEDMFDVTDDLMQGLDQGEAEEPDFRTEEEKK